MQDKPSICFVALRAYPVLAQSNDLDFIGGAEVQQVLLAKALARKNYRVSFISFDFGQPDDCVIDGVSVYKICKPGEGLPVLKFAHPFLSSLWRALNAANASILYQRSASRLTGLVSAYAKRNRSGFIYAGAHDTDFIPGQELMPSMRDKLLYRYGLRNADTVVVQSPHQAKLLESAYGASGTLIGSCCVQPSEPSVAKDIDVLWVGTFRSWKRPELFIELAKACPERQFAMIGGPASDEPSPYLEAQEAAKSIDNLQLNGFMPYAQTETYFDRAKVFVNTSVWEGFPNTFLQAWSRKVPTLAFFDASTLGENAGHRNAVGNVSEAVEVIQSLLADERTLARTGQQCYDYYERFHTLAAVIAQYETLLAELSLPPPAVPLATHR